LTKPSQKKNRVPGGNARNRQTAPQLDRTKEIGQTITRRKKRIKKKTGEFHKLLTRYKDHPALVGDATEADALLLTLMLTLLELVRPVVVEVMSVEVGEDADDDELPETGEVMEKTGLMSLESPYKQIT